MNRHSICIHACKDSNTKDHIIKQTVCFYYKSSIEASKYWLELLTGFVDIMIRIMRLGRISFYISNDSLNRKMYSTGSYKILGIIIN